MEALSGRQTEKGVEHFRNWVRAPSSAPVSREELHAKIALCEPRDLPRLIDAVHTEELACIVELDRIRERMVAEQRLAAGRTAAEAGPRTQTRQVLRREAPKTLRIGPDVAKFSPWIERSVPGSA